MRALILGALLAMSGPCATPAPPPLSTPPTADAAIAAWTDAYNRDEVEQLRWLVHPEQRKVFDEGRTVLDAELEVWQSVRFMFGPTVQVQGRLTGREVTVEITDGRRTEKRLMVLVEEEGRWWVWRP